jgi:hypothetical protein
VLGKLGNALDIVTQRVAGEIHALVEVTLDEVEERSVTNPSSTAHSFRSEQKREEAVMSQSQVVAHTEGESFPASSRRHSLVTPADNLRIAVSLNTMSPPHHAAIIRDLFWTLYSKLAAVLEGHRVVYEVARWIPSVCALVRDVTLISAPRLPRYEWAQKHTEHTRRRDLEACPTRGPQFTVLVPIRQRAKFDHRPSPHPLGQRGSARRQNYSRPSKGTSFLVALDCLD